MVVVRERWARRWAATRLRIESFFALAAKAVRALAVVVEGAKMEV